MGRVAVLMAEGYEEGETLTIVDLLRRGDQNVIRLVLMKNL